jgi:hypothetical protein
MITQDRIKELLDYRNGDLFWKVTKSAKAVVGSKAGSVNAKGHVNLQIDGKLYAAHRLVFLLFNGYLPKEVDHINRVKTDNQIENLRACSSSNNKGNISLLRNNKSGYRGVSLNRRSGKWHAQIKVYGIQTYLGRFDSAEEAAVEYNRAAIKHFGEFAFLNKVRDAIPC